MKHGILTISLSLIAIIFFALSGCNCKCRTAEEIKIGVIAMLSGANVRDGVQMSNAANLACRNINEKGGIPIGRDRMKVLLLFENDRNNPEDALNAARRLICQEDVVALVGPQFSRNAIPVARFAESEGVVMICPMSTHPDTTAGKNYVFRIPYIDTVQGRALANFARESLQASTAAVLYDISSAYNRMLAEVFREAFEKAGGRITAFEFYTSNHSEDFSEQLGRIAGASPDVLFLPNYCTDVILQARQAREKGIEATLLGGDGWSQERLVNERVFDGAYFTRHWHPLVAKGHAADFVLRYEELYGISANDVAATTYDAVTMLLAAMERAGSMEPEKVRNTLYRMDDFIGVTGSIRYENSGDPVKSVIVVRIEEGKVSFFSKIEP
jgi:branched-chain amino acid transport system substrate-binding protein